MVPWSTQTAILLDTWVDTGESEISTNVPSAFLRRIRNPKSCESLTFEYIDANGPWQITGDSKTRGEFYMGCIIGTDVISPAKLEKKLTELRKRTLFHEKQCFTINDLGEDRSGKTCTITEDRGWRILLESPDNGQLIDEARSLLLDALLSQGIDDVDSSHLQCNVNKYRSNDKMTLHRDDRDEKCSTFYPAAVTCLLYADVMTTHDQAKACFELYESKSRAKLTLDKRKDGSRRQYEVVCKDHLIASESRSDTLVCVAGASYTKGLHAARTGWRGGAKSLNNSSPFPFERISLNFRMVRPAAWTLLQNIGLANRTKFGLSALK